jgi:hypothetical protein
MTAITMPLGWVAALDAAETNEANAAARKLAKARFRRNMVSTPDTRRITNGNRQVRLTTCLPEIRRRNKPILLFA